MIVFLVNTHVSDFTVWWNGSDQAVQTPLAYTNTYFTGDNPSNGVLTNGQLSMQISGTGQQFSVTATNGPSTSTTNFMTVNNQACTCGAGAAYVIYDGVVRDIIQQEAEWSNGITNCPNVYANMVLTLPANATYFTYQLSFMFLDSQQTRTISEPHSALGVFFYWDVAKRKRNSKRRPHRCSRHTNIKQHHRNMAASLEPIHRRNQRRRHNVHRPSQPNALHFRHFYVGNWSNSSEHRHPEHFPHANHTESCFIPKRIRRYMVWRSSNFRRFFRPNLRWTG